MKSIVPEIFYRYDENRALLTLHFDPSIQTVTIKGGGRHGFARLAETFAIYAMMSAKHDHLHWDPLKASEHELTIILNDDLEKK